MKRKQRRITVLVVLVVTLLVVSAVTAVMAASHHKSEKKAPFVLIVEIDGVETVFTEGSQIIDIPGPCRIWSPTHALGITNMYWVNTYCTHYVPRDYGYKLDGGCYDIKFQPTDWWGDPDRNSKPIKIWKIAAN